MGKIKTRVKNHKNFGVFVLDAEDVGREIYGTWYVKAKNDEEAIKYFLKEIEKIVREYIGEITEDLDPEEEEEWEKIKPGEVQIYH